MLGLDAEICRVLKSSLTPYVARDLIYSLEVATLPVSSRLVSSKPRTVSRDFVIFLSLGVRL